MTRKRVVCRCEDVTVHDVDEAMASGYRDLESVKRYTGLATGWCQGKQCLAPCARLIAARGGEASTPITPRPPYHPVSLRRLASVLDAAAPPSSAHAPRPAPTVHVPRPPASHPPLPESADFVIVGGGIMGLATAYHLARLRAGRIVVLDRGYLCGGASGRNGGGVRAQWSSTLNIQLMKESLRLCADFATQMRINTWFRRGGYLFLARRASRAKQLANSQALQEAEGLRTRMIGPKEVQALVPELDVSDVEAASWNPDDAVVFPWPFVWGYARACRELGVALHTFTDVTGIDVQGGRVHAARTTRGVIRTPVLISATGAWSPELAKLVDVELPNHPHRHEICSTEPLKPFLGPFVGDLDSGLYFSQSARGEIVGGISNEAVPPGLDQESSLRFLGLYGRELARTMPRLGRVRVLRQWAGCYDLTPDGSPIIGETPGVGGFHQLCGFMGHGFMMAPVMGRLMARHLVHGEEQALFDRWSLRRFAEGRLLQETMILG